jgi:hypothetical protein
MHSRATAVGTNLNCGSLGNGTKIIGSLHSLLCSPSHLLAISNDARGTLGFNRNNNKMSVSIETTYSYKIKIKIAIKP